MYTWDKYKKEMAEKQLNHWYIVLSYTKKTVNRNKAKKEIKHWSDMKKNNQND